MKQLGSPLLRVMLPLAMLAAAVPALGAPAGDDVQKPAAVEGTVIVKFTAGRSLNGASKTGSAVFDAAAARLQVREMRQLFALPPNLEAGKRTRAVADMQQVYEVHYDADVPPRIAAALLSQDAGVAYAEPRYVYSLSEEASRQEPNDPQFADMAHLRHIGMPEAWDVVKASDGNVLIAVVDAGTDWRHPDLSGNVWFNSFEIDGNGVDDDGNGFVDDARGWNFSNDTNDPTGLSDTPSNGRHGTIVAGIAAAVTNNNTGIAGASWNARLLPVNVGCASADNSVCYGFDGILYAAMQGADVINVSWGGPDSFFGRDVVQAASDLGALLIVSAGNNGAGLNEGANIDVNPAYPASYDRVMVVGSTGKTSDAKADFSNYGLSVDVFAPGQSINSVVPDQGYTSNASGTSFSTPIVVGLAAMLRAQHPAWSIDKIREQIRVTSDPIDSVNPSFNGLLGRGRINAMRAIGNVESPSIRVAGTTLVDSGNDGSIQAGETVQMTLDLTNYLADASNVTLRLESQDPFVNLQDSRIAIGALDSDASTTVRFTFALSAQTPGDHRLTFRLAITGDDYSDADLIALTVNRVSHNTGRIEMTLTDQGNIGWSDFQNSSGKGFRFLGIDWMFEGGLLIGTREERISDSVRNTGVLTQDNDLARPDGSFFGITPGAASTEAGLVILNDETSQNPIGIRVHQESYADTREEYASFIVLRYLISHNEKEPTQAIDNLYVGLFTDWDLTTGGDYARFDSGRRMGIVQSSEEDPLILFGARMLTNDASLSYRSIDNAEIFDSRSDGDGFTNAEKWNFMTGGIQVRDVDDTDVSTLIAAGPYRIEPGDFVEIAFALIAAVGTDDFLIAADHAQQFWNETISGLNPNPVAVEDPETVESLETGMPYPNPARSQVTIDLDLPQSGTIDISIYDILGREVYSIKGEPRPAGRHRLRWDTRNGSGLLVPGGLYVYRLRATTPGGTYSATRKFVVVR